ncbi:glycosyltransferase [Aureisphaera galaxeae]|uniref:glycosyltransferase family protein n=1 Tax=Aureisphaera galaxeae TaxID=1538023 RepID=UPI00234FD988|nr:glycosyltransferase [Aureisphaera galaxeae]MDC8004462.1 glycosyltransferase [Aureisphaera galaxeae]
MQVLLLGEYSRLHNNLKEGLVSLGHEVTLVGDGDGFKNFDVDISIRPSFFSLPGIDLIRKAIFRITKFDLFTLEKGIKFSRKLKQLKGYDVVQLINEKPIKTMPWLERRLLKKIIANNGTVYLLSCGADTFVVNFLLAQKPKYSILTPYLNDPSLKPTVQYILDYAKKGHRKTHELLMKHVKGIIASDMDYVLPLEGHPKFKGLIPNPVNLERMEYKPLSITDKINIFLGINRGNRFAKGVPFFEKALKIIQEKYPSAVNIVTVTNLPYKEYIVLFEEAHILLDQVFGYDQGYNALEAMARGKVVFTGAETEFLQHYGLQEDEVCINALPDVDYLVSKLSWLVENKDAITRIGANARTFVEKEHEYRKVAQKYLDTWTS